MSKQNPTTFSKENCNEATEKICSTLKCIATDIAETDDEPPCDTASIKIIEKSGESAVATARGIKSAICEKVKVIVRCRPISPKEIQEKCESIVKVDLDRTCVEIHVPKISKAVSQTQIPEMKCFFFDCVYDSRVTQRQLYEESFRPLVDSVLEGFNGTIFAYGQTGTGKTYTMEGKRGDESHNGVIPNSFVHIFQHISANSTELKQFLIQASYLEIYQEEIRDLLCDKGKSNNLELRESPASGVYVQGLTSRLCGSFNEIEELMARGNKNRSVGATNMNEHSSRSHAIFTITVDMSETLPTGKTLFKVGKLNLVDLAGSERQTKTGATGDRLKEASKINLSLSALGNVIAALVDERSSHIPYRDSKLTRLLQDSLGGNSKTVMVATIGPACSNRDETITTLRYANRAKNIKNKPKVNEDPKDALLREYQEEIINLRNELEKRKTRKSIAVTPETPSPVSSVSSPKSKVKGESKVVPNKPAENRNSAGSQRVSELATLLEPYGIDPTLPPQEIMEKLAAMRKDLLEDNMQVKNEKDQLLKKLDNTTNYLKNVQKECSHLAARISWLESKVFMGGKGKDLVRHTEEQAKHIEAKKMELSQHIQRYAEMEKKFHEEKYSIEQLKLQSAEAEVELVNKSKKYDKVCRRLQSTKSEVKAKQEKVAADLEALRKMQKDLRKEFGLKRMIIDNFIPRSTRKEIEKRMVWDGECYKVTSPPEKTIEEINPLVDRSLSVPLFNISSTGVIHEVPHVHFTNENILQLHPEVPLRKTKDYIPPSTDPRVTALMNKAFQDIEKSVVIDCSPQAQVCGVKRSQVMEQKECISIGDAVVRRVTPTTVNYTAKAGDELKSTQFFDFSVVSNHSSSKVDQRLLTQYILDSLSHDN